MKMRGMASHLVAVLTRNSSNSDKQDENYDEAFDFNW